MKTMVCVDGPRMGTVATIPDGQMYVSFVRESQVPTHYVPGSRVNFAGTSEYDAYSVETIDNGRGKLVDILVHHRSSSPQETKP